MRKGKLMRDKIMDRVAKKDEKLKKMLSSPVEKILVKELKKASLYDGVDYFWQYPIADRYIVDIAFVDEMIIFELDGAFHRGEKQRLIDVKRDCFLEKLGWQVYRIKNSDFISSPKFWVSFILNLLKLS